MSIYSNLSCLSLRNFSLVGVRGPASVIRLMLSVPGVLRYWVINGIR